MEQDLGPINKLIVALYMFYTGKTLKHESATDSASIQRPLKLKGMSRTYPRFEKKEQT